MANKWILIIAIAFNPSSLVLTDTLVVGGGNLNYSVELPPPPEIRVVTCADKKAVEAAVMEPVSYVRSHPYTISYAVITPEGKLITLTKEPVKKLVKREVEEYVGERVVWGEPTRGR